MDRRVELVKCSAWCGVGLGLCMALLAAPTMDDVGTLAAYALGLFLLLGWANGEILVQVLQRSSLCFRWLGLLCIVLSVGAQIWGAFDLGIKHGRTPAGTSLIGAGLVLVSSSSVVLGMTWKRQKQTIADGGGPAMKPEHP